MSTKSPASPVVPDPELQGYERPYHWFMPRDSVWTRIHDAYVERTVHHVRQSGARRVLEVGCGDGWNCQQLRQAGLDVTGVDWSARGIGLARCLVPNGRFVVGDLRDPSVRADLRPPFDAMIMVEVIEHIPPADCGAALRTIGEYLNPGGILVITTPSVNWPNTNPRHFRHFSPKTLREAVKQAGGFSVECIEGYGDVPSVQRFLRLKLFIDNRLYRLKPILNRWLDRIELASHATKPERAMGLVAVLRSVEADAAGRDNDVESIG